MSWHGLQAALQGMPATGNDGLEGLVALLLGELLDQRFHLARAGVQPGGDAANAGGSVSLQTKRYKNRDPSIKEIIGDFQVALDELEELDTYVVAVTRNTQQLQQRLESQASQTGVDILCLGLCGEGTELEALCAYYWDAVASRFGELTTRLDSESCEWVEAQGRTDEIGGAVERLRCEISERAATVARLRIGFHDQIRSLVGLPSEHPTRRSLRFDLADAVDRASIQSQLERWVGTDSPATRLQGEEGCGKTWAAAAFAKSCLETDECLCIWLSSSDWSGHRSLREVLVSAIGKLETEPSKQERMLRCLIRPRPLQIALVLDGANEKSGAESIGRVLDDLIGHRRQYANFRIVITTRPLERRPGTPRDVWLQCECIEVGPFTDEELRDALDRLEPGLHLEDIPEAVRDIIHVPRYARICVKLRSRLGALEHVTPEVLHWVALLERIDERDSQVGEALGWQTEEDAAAVLSRLASNVEAGTAVSAELFAESFGRPFEGIRRDLEELRLASGSTPLGGILERDHAVLGWALYLLEVLVAQIGDGIAQLVERLEAELEPATDDELRTEALFVAYQLSRLRTGGSTAEFALLRGAVLCVWVPAPNSRVDEGMLDSLVGADAAAYCLFVEHFYKGIYRGNAQQTVVDPLGRAWERGGTECDVISTFLKRWVLLSRPLDAEGEEYEHDGHRLPIAETREQLRLSSVALSISSLRPDPALLPEVALCAATASVSRERTAEREMPIKSVSHNLQYLMRWSYGEAAIDDLLSLARTSDSDSLLLKGLRILANHLAVADLPPELEPPKRTDVFPTSVSPKELLQEGKRLFHRDEGEPRVMFAQLPFLAARDDLPGLGEEDRSTLVSELRSVVQEGGLGKGRSMSAELSRLRELLPWLARESPEELTRLIELLRNAALSNDHPEYLLNELAGSSQGGLGDDRYQLLPRLLEPDTVQEGWAAERHLLVMELAGASDLEMWLRVSSTNPALRHALRVLPVPDALNTRKDLTVDPGEFDADDEDVVAFWALVLHLTGGGTERWVEWARAEFLRREWSDDTRWCLLTLYGESLGNGWLEPIREDNDLRQNLRREDYWTLDRAARHPAVPTGARLNLEEALRELPQDLVGIWLSESADDAGLRAWGRQLLHLVTVALRQPPQSATHRGGTKIELDDKGRLSAIAHENRDDSPDLSLGSTSSWGVDYAGFAELNQHLTGDVPAADPDSAAWDADFEALQAWEHFDLFRFNGEPALRAWAERHPQEFRRIVHSIFDGLVETRARHFHAGRLLELLLRLQLYSEVEWVYEMYVRVVDGNVRIRVLTDYGAPAIWHELWDVSRKSTEEHNRVRLRTFTDARTDADIQSATLPVLARGAEVELRALLADRFLESPHGHERALALSALRWIPRDWAITDLERVIKDDPSRWVRGFASESLSIAQAEECIRRLYRESVQNADVVRVSAMLQQIRPVLTGTALQWHHQVDADLFAAGEMPEEVRALLLRFWTHWENVRANRTKCHGKDLSKMYLGERIDSFVSPRMYPLWRPRG